MIIETNCSSWFEQRYERLCPNNDHCFSSNDFVPSRDCNDSVRRECQRIEDWKILYPEVTELFRCNSGDCVPNSQVCDNVSNCHDGSDETGCPGIA